MTPRFPLYIPTKGRADSRLTIKALQKMRLPFYAVIEEQEYDQYADVLDPKHLLILDPEYKRQYELCDDLGLTKSTGPGPARNFAWDHAIKNGYEYHWVMDDNIAEFLRLTGNLKIRIGDGTGFRAMEDFCLRYENVTMAGPNYRAFASQNSVMPPFVMNTRIYSCNLIKNDSKWLDGRPFRWRGRYNEDTILSLDMLTEGYCTVQFNAFLQDKMRTQLLGGGNSEEFYFKEGTYAKSKMLEDVYPKYTKLTEKFGRIHHEVNYRPFKNNPLKFKPDYQTVSGSNEYGMTLRRGWNDHLSTFYGDSSDD